MVPVRRRTVTAALALLIARPMFAERGAAREASPRHGAIPNSMLPRAKSLAINGARVAARTLADCAMKAVKDSPARIVEALFLSATFAQSSESSR